MTWTCIERYCCAGAWAVPFCCDVGCAWDVNGRRAASSALPMSRHGAWAHGTVPALRLEAARDACAAAATLLSRSRAFRLLPALFSSHQQPRWLRALPSCSPPPRCRPPCSPAPTRRPSSRCATRISRCRARRGAQKSCAQELRGSAVLGTWEAASCGAAPPPLTRRAAVAAAGGEQPPQGAPLPRSARGDPACCAPAHRGCSPLCSRTLASLPRHSGAARSCHFFYLARRSHFGSAPFVPALRCCLRCWPRA